MEAMTQLMQGGAGASAPTPGGGSPTGAQAPEAGPASSPAASPMQPKGAQAGAAVQVQQAVKILKQTIAQFPYDSEEWKAIDKALSALMKKFPAQESAGMGQAGLVKLMTQSGASQ